MANVKVLLALFIVGLLGLAVVINQGRLEAEAALNQLTARVEQPQGGNTEQNQQAAAQVVTRVRRHVDIPADVQPTVAQIVDVAKLRKSNPFYSRAVNGDYLIITPTRAYLYSPSRDIILDVVPVQSDPQIPASSASGSGKAANSRAKRQ